VTHSHSRRGFSLVETMLSVALMALIFLGAMNLYISGLQAATKSDAQLTANATAANGLQHVEQDVSEAYFCVLPSTTPAPNPAFGSDLGTGYPLADFRVTYFDPSLSANRTINTGLKIVFPAVAPLTVYQSSGAHLSLSRYDTSAAGTALYIYRADLPANRSAGTPATPDPAQGDCLWASGYENGAQINQCFAKLSDSRSAAGGRSTANMLPNAVEFIKPPEINSLEIRLISSYYSATSSSNSTISGQQSNESNKTLLTGKCLFMQDHQQGGS
jgi:prepilin-type N-terminal cleavage/methylation domain-containing protein